MSAYVDREALPVAYLPMEVVDKMHSPCSQFVRWLVERLGNVEAVRGVYEAYRLGATRTGGVIFWQIDIEGRLRTGKVMHYHPDGHRVKDAEDFARMRGVPFTEKSPQPLYFYHSQLRRQGVIGEGQRVEQCLFGEHLLAGRPDATVCLVESEKTAVVCSILYPQYLWLATGGCQQLSVRKLAVLRGREVVVYPDSGELELWTKIMGRTEGISYRIVKEMEGYERNMDIADVVLGGIKKADRSECGPPKGYES